MTHDLPSRDPCMDRFCQPLPVVYGECLCGVILIEGEDDGTNCSACGADICEQCADRNHCRREDCDNTYCDKCAARFLPPAADVFCVTCGSPWRHRQAAYQRLVAAMMEPLGRTR